MKSRSRKSPSRGPSHLIISPGPCTPSEAGISCAAVTYFTGKLPILGVCLGHQSIGQACGAEIVRAERLMHGKVDLIHHDGQGLFSGLPNPFEATRYHSLVIRPGTLPADYEVTAWSELPDGGREIMGVRHRSLPVFGVQFHPESFLSPAGVEILTRFLAVGSTATGLRSMLGNESATAEPVNSAGIPGIRIQSLDPAIEVTED